MPLNDALYETYRESRSSRLLAGRCRVPVEAMVSQYYQTHWAVTDFRDMHDYSSHPSALLSDGNHAVFVKLSEAAHGLHQFEVELAGLRLLAEQAGVLIPTPIGIQAVDGGVIMVMEAVESVERTPHEWREIGRTLAKIHQIPGAVCGLDQQGYFGPLYQDNRPLQDWLSFYIERRLWPRLMGAIDSGSLPIETIRQVERFIALLPHLDIPQTNPVLLHGDAQQNNFISTRLGAVVIDPAVHYGNPEMDLAYVDYFQPVPEDVFLGYQELLPIEPGFSERRDLWRVSAYLAAVQAEGPVRTGMLTTALRKYV